MPYTSKMRGIDCLVLALASILAAALPALSYPDYFVQQYSNGVCTAHPDKAYGDHGSPTSDRDASIEFTPLTSLPTLSKLCPGARYSVKVQFPQPRLALLTTNTGVFEDADSACPNRLVTQGKAPVGTWETTIRIPCSAAGQSLQLKLTSAHASIGAFRTTTATVAISSQGGECQQVSKAACANGDAGQSSGVIPSSRFDPTQAGARSADVTGDASSRLAAPVFSLRPILKTNRMLWQFLHSLLMLLSFGLLMPLGALLARHKWLFGRNHETGKVSAGWYYLHLLVQLLAVLAAIAGAVLAILAFGWKDVPGMVLYLPHKWLGVGVMAMALLQVLVAPIRPKPDSPSRPSWNFWHHSWGRLTLLAGAANTVIGALLIHDLKDTSYLHWLLPSCVVLGAMVALALILEAFKLQMQRTYRYHPRTGVMLPVEQGHKNSKRRRGDQLAAAAAAAFGATPAPGIHNGNGHYATSSNRVTEWMSNGHYDESAYPAVHLDAPDTATIYDQA